MCKYTPVELFAGFQVPCRRLEELTDSFEAAESLGHPNICGYGKALLEAALAPEVDELILVNCCDVVRRIYDILEQNKKMGFLYLLDLPHKNGEAEEGMFQAQLGRLLEAYEQYSGREFQPELAWAALKAAEVSSDGGAQSHLSLQGAHSGAHLRDLVQKHFNIPVCDDTCSGNRQIAAADKKPATAREFMTDYGKALLNQIPCMRMMSIKKRKVLTGGARGIIYHTMKFCDYYSFEYANIKDSREVPLLKIETDGTRQSSGQLSTRLDAFAESLSLSDTERETKRDGRYTAGIDSGSASTDVVILDQDKNLVAWSVVPTGAGAAAGAGKALAGALEKAGLTEADLGKIVSTGYGRETIGRGDASVTEITCHARGAHYLNPEARTVIDIGGQDSKVICIDGQGTVQNFVMNDKCAAGTGRFLEMMARTMELTMEEMSALGQKWREDVTISSMCTVFAESEVVSLIARNTPSPDIIHGLNKAVAAKTAALIKRVGGEEVYMMTGGVARNEGIVRVLEEKLGTRIYVSEYAQLCGAIGAALIAME